MSFRTPRGYPSREARERGARAARRAKFMFVGAGLLAICWLGVLIRLVLAIVSYLERH